MAFLKQISFKFQLPAAPTTQLILTPMGSKLGHQHACRIEMQEWNVIHYKHTFLHKNVVLNTYLEDKYNYCHPHTQQNSTSNKKSVTELSNDWKPNRICLKGIIHSFNIKFQKFKKSNFQQEDQIY